MAGLGELLYGFNNSPMGNLSGLLMQREQLQNAREDRERRKQQEQMQLENQERRQQVLADLHGLAADPQLGPEAARDAALGYGMTDIAEAYQGVIDSQRAGQMHELDLGRKREELLQLRTDNSLKTEKDLQTRFGSLTHSLTGGTAEGWMQNADLINRSIEMNPREFQTMMQLPKHRIPKSLEYGQLPNGQTVVSVTIENTKTKTTGPATQNASADPKDQVITMPLESLVRTVNQWAGVEPQEEASLAAAGADRPKEFAPKGFDVRPTPDGGYLTVNKDTGQVSRTDPDAMRTIENNVDRTFKRPGMLDGIDMGGIVDKQAAVEDISKEAVLLGANPEKVVTKVLNLLRTNVGVVEEWRKASKENGIESLEFARAQEALIQLMLPGGRRMKQKQEQGLSAVQPKLKASPKKTMPKRPEGLSRYAPQTDFMSP